MSLMSTGTTKLICLCPLNQLSILELVLLNGEDAFLVLFFRSWPPYTVYSLRRTNHVLCTVADRYIRLGWDPDFFLRGWFDDPFRFRCVLDSTFAIVAGTVPFRLFDRHLSRQGDLDLVIQGWGLRHLGGYLQNQGYQYVHGDRDSITASVADILSYSAARSMAHTDDLESVPVVRELRFVRTVRNSHGCGSVLKNVRVHLVRINPMRFILSLKSSECCYCVLMDCAIITIAIAPFMTVLTGSVAVCVFPRSTFVHERLYMCTGTRTAGALHQRWRWYTSANGFEIMRNRDRRDNSETMTGCRSVGDSVCWKIKFARPTCELLISYVSRRVNTDCRGHSGVS